MSDHPSIDALLSHLTTSDPGVKAHLDACVACSRRSDRLAGGLALVDEARSHAPVPPPWERIDDVLAVEAGRVSQQIQAARLQSSRTPSWAASALAMAAGVGLLLGGRAMLRSRETPTTAPVAVRATNTAAPTPSFTPYEGVVLLSAGGSSYRERPEATEVSLARVASLREGARVETPTAARAVFTVRSGWTADVRPNSALDLSQLRAENTEVTLGRGEVALSPATGETGPVRLRHHGWAIEAHGPVVARLESSSLRVVVLAGRTDVRRGDGEVVSVTGPLVLDLPLDGGAAIRTALIAQDRDALDLGAFSARGASFEVPTIDPAATLTLLNHGALPSALETVRLASAGTLQARVGRNELRLELGAGGSPRWATFRSQAAPSIALNRVQAAPTPAPPSPVEDPSPGLSAAALRAVSNSTARRIQHCFATCLEQNRCRETMSGDVTFAVSDQGRATVASLDPSLEGARRCLVNDAQFLPVPRTGGAYDFQVGVGAR